ETQHITHIRAVFSLTYVRMTASKSYPTVRNLLCFRCKAVLKEEIFDSARQKSADILTYFKDF
ncbi:MAG: hypothetical protein IIX16_08770, partial [Clostridia bacterium]|nr:hypothetical protein [Clostridia bacterium]